MNEVLKEYRISKATNPLTLIGNEEDSRFFTLFFLFNLW
ncbi:hypothetical protein B834_2102 [Enterococcus mundtii 1A]|nr:hypothetical protein [Enterococcus mundtii 1A]